jgi:drug/metabolite transporter (DMT)-like permease
VEQEDPARASILNEQRQDSSRQLLPVAILVLVCLFWGYSFPVMQFGTQAFDRHVLPATAGEMDKFASRALFNGVRYLLATLLYGVVTRRRQRGYSRHDVVGGIVVGVLFASGMFFQVVGLRWVLPSVSGFFTALPVVFAPLAQSAILKKPVGRKTWIAVALAVAGILLLSWPKPGAVGANTVTVVPPIRYLGESLTIIGALIFTAEIISVHHFGQNSDPVRLTLVMIATTALFSLALGVVLGGPWLLRPAAMLGMVRDKEFIWTMSTLICISSLLALHLMNTFQPRVSPAIASVIYCTEPLFSTMFSLIFATEILTKLTVAGGLAVTASVLVIAARGKSHAAKE